MRWLRLYDDVLDDPKVQQLPPPLFKHWINLLCLASKSEPRGTLPDLPAIAFRLRLSTAKTREVIGDLVQAGLLDLEGDTAAPHEWSHHQPRSDDVAQRVRRHRNGEGSNVTGNVTGNDPETLLKRSRQEVEEDTEKDIEPETGVPPLTPRQRAESLPGFQAFWDEYPKHEERKAAEAQWRRLRPDDCLQDRIMAAIAVQRAGRKWQEGYVKGPHRWLRDESWTDEVEPPRSLPTNGQHPPPSHTERTADAVTGANAILARMYGWGNDDDVIDTTGRVTG